MSLTNPNTPVSQQDLQDFYHKLLPYMGGSSTGGGHTIEDSEGTELTQREVLQFGEGFLAEDDDTNEKTVILPDVMQSGDMDDVITPLPSVAPKKEGIKYSTTEQVIGEWIDGKPLYQKTFIFTSALSVSYTAWTQSTISLSSNHIESIVNCIGHASLGAIGSIAIYPLLASANSSAFTHLAFITPRNNGNDSITGVTIQYTKTTDTPNT